MVALLAGSAILLISCDTAPKATEISDEKIISRTVRDMEAISSENGHKKQLMRTPLMEEHKFARPAFEEYTRGVEFVGYDSLGRPSQRIVSDYALHWIERDTWELKGNVFAEGDGGTRKYYTQQLFYDVKQEKIWSNVDSKIEDGGNVYYPQGFEAKDDFSVWEFRGVKGTVEVDVEPTADSTAVDTPGGNSRDAGDGGSGSADSPAPVTTTPAAPDDISVRPAPAERRVGALERRVGALERRVERQAPQPEAVRHATTDQLIPES